MYVYVCVCIYVYRQQVENNPSPLLTLTQFITKARKNKRGERNQILSILLIFWSVLLLLITNCVQARLCVLSCFNLYSIRNQQDPKHKCYYIIPGWQYPATRSSITPSFASHLSYLLTLPLLLLFPPFLRLSSTTSPQTAPQNQHRYNQDLLSKRNTDTYITGPETTCTRISQLYRPISLALES